MLGIKDNEQVVIGVGQIQQRKGIEDFIDIAAMFPEIKFVWAGGRPWGMFTEGIARINKKIKNAGDNLIFTGLLDISDMPVIYAAADIFLFPSYQENCPLAPLEAAAAGLPVIFRDLAEYQSLYAVPYLKASDNEGFAKIIYSLLTDGQYQQDALTISKNLLSDFDKNGIKC